AGDFVAIAGPSGSGKSTLANVIGGLDRPDSGQVMVNGMNLATAKDKQLSAYRNSNVGFVFQSFNLQVHETALENVISPLVIGGVGRKKERRLAGLAALEKVGLADRAHHKPTQLSGGQRQRVAIARALVNNPSVVIADEPTGNLDSARGVEVMEELARLNREDGITLIVITHDTGVAERATRVLTIIDGKVSERVGAR
ncbi:MAG: ATP-binding cassette domain-containing protein, partial [Actinobacteria bacterium]|nr:ATP-binding cassette domain-containing protein [Actinomycetota bacterium]